MQEPDFSNPIVVITAFFGVLFSAVAFFVRIIPVAIASGGILAGIGALIGSTLIIFKILLGD